jgi:hypothetical protein
MFGAVITASRRPGGLHDTFLVFKKKNWKMEKIMNKKIFIWFTIVLFIIPVQYAQSKYSKINMEDLLFVNNLNNKKIGVSNKLNELKYLGDNIKELKYKGSEPVWNLWTYYWNGIKLDAFEGNGSINYLEINGTNYKSSRGIKIGDNIKSVIQKYGEPDIKQKNVLGYVLLTEDYVWGLDFYYKNDLVERVVIGRDD